MELFARQDARECYRVAGDDISCSQTGLGQPIVDLKHQLTSLKSIFLGQGDTTSLRGRAMNSGAWIGAGFAVQKALQFGSNLILTRLLFPEAFGLMALASVFMVGLAMFSDVGIKPAIIRDPRGDDPDFLNTAWTIQVVRGVILCIAGVLISYPISILYGQPLLFPILACLSTTALISGFTSVSMATAERKLSFKTITIVQISSQLISTISTIFIVYFWNSIWSLVISNILSSLFLVILSLIFLDRHRHKLRIERRAFNSLLTFGRWIFLSTLLTYCGGEGLKALQGGLISPSEFGVLAIAYSMASIPNDLATRLASSIGLPVLAETFRNSPERARAILRRFRFRMMAMSTLTATAIALVAQPMISLLYDYRYHHAGTYLAILVISNSILPACSGYGSALLATGQSRTYFFNMFITAVFKIFSIYMGFKILGIIGMLVAIGISNIFSLLVYMALVRKMDFRDYFLDSMCIFSTIFIATSLKLLLYWA
ncbi:MAG: oligosaccharide flippase family protein [Sphingopyxis sp.]|nr:oligosaccharide flippase family protein [Sphingopyxis sp.]